MGLCLVVSRDKISNVCLSPYSQMKNWFACLFCITIFPNGFISAAIGKKECSFAMEHAILHLSFIASFSRKSVNALTLHPNKIIKCSLLEFLNKQFLTVGDIWQSWINWHYQEGSFGIMTGTMLNKYISQISVAYKLIEICDAVIMCPQRIKTRQHCKVLALHQTKLFKTWFL